MNIYDHAVDKYIMRILNLDPSNVGDNIRKFSRKQIKKAYENPDEIRSLKKNMPPFYIKNDVALVVANEKYTIGERTVYKYNNDGGDIIIPTVYTKKMAYSKDNDKQVQHQKGVT